MEITIILRVLDIIIALMMIAIIFKASEIAGKLIEKEKLENNRKVFDFENIEKKYKYSKGDILPIEYFIKGYDNLALQYELSTEKRFELEYLIRPKKEKTAWVCTTEDIYRLIAEKSYEDYIISPVLKVIV